MEYYAFSDGGCINNGKKNAIASYCSILIDGKTKQIKKGLVMPNKYILNLPLEAPLAAQLEAPLAAPLAAQLDILSIDESIKIAPSNNRGELLGIIYCFIPVSYTHLTLPTNREV